MKLTIDPTLEPESNGVPNGNGQVTNQGGAKTFVLYFEFELGDFKTHSTRLQEAYSLATAAVEAALRKVIPDEAIKGLRSRMRYFYLQLDGQETSWQV